MTKLSKVLTENGIKIIIKLLHVLLISYLEHGLSVKSLSAKIDEIGVLMFPCHSYLNFFPVLESQNEK